MFFSEQFLLRPKACYSTQGAERKNNNSNAKVNLEYIGIPVMTKYHLVDGFNIHVGTQFSFLSKAEAKGEIDGSGTVDIKDSTESFDFGVNFGVGYEFAAGVFVDVRYNMRTVESKQRKSSKFL